MAIKSSDQISIIDITDAYSVILTNDSYTFPGTVNAAKAGSCTTQIIAMRGSEQVAASVNLSNVTKPAGITVTKDSDATSPTLTITASTSFTTAGVVKIPVVVDGDITINKEFSVAIAFTGQTGQTGPQGPQGETGATGNGVATILKWAEKYRYTPAELEEAGVIRMPTGPGDRGYHRFGGRLMFTIRDKQGRVGGAGILVLPRLPEGSEFRGQRRKDRV